MSQTVSEKTNNDKPDWSVWRLPEDFEKPVEAIHPEEAGAHASGGEPQHEGETPHQGATVAMEDGPSDARAPGAAAGSVLSPTGFGEDYQTYTTLSNQFYSLNSAVGSDATQATPNEDELDAQSAEESQRLAQSAIEVLNRIWGTFSGQSVSRGDLRNVLGDARINGTDRATVQQLIEDDRAFDWLDRLDQRRDGRIARSTIDNYALGDQGSGTVSSPTALDNANASDSSGAASLNNSAQQSM